ncbi:MAG: hypothetical protein DCF17_21540, partial [Shackletoniella antarctica]
MGHSYAESVALSCPSCRAEFVAQCWQIVDGVERPDLLKRIQRGKLHRMVCPDCGQVAANLDQPLLIYRPGQTLPLLFSPAEKTSPEEDQTQSQALVMRLRQGLGTAWQDRWVEQGLTGVPRQQLAQVLESGLPVEVSGESPSSEKLGDLRSILQELSQPVQDIRQMGRRVELCRQALTLVSHQGNEELWAALQGKLGISLQQNPLGDRAQNMEDAIAAYQQALTVMTQTAMPVDWATTMMNLATAYSNRIRGDRAQNMEDAIAAYQQALTV